LRAGDPSAPPVSGRGEPYTLEIFQRAQAEKKIFWSAASVVSEQRCLKMLRPRRCHSAKRQQAQRLLHGHVETRRGPRCAAKRIRTRTGAELTII